jgi:phosphoribosyl-AMP cyclohydrolase
MIDFDTLKYENNLIFVVVQDYISREVLMCAYMNREALEKTIETGIAHFWSRSRQKLWKKGETSGNVQKVNQIKIDCDMDSILLLVEQVGGACHMGYRSCFFRNIEGKIIDEKVFEPEDVY